jgi:hypothetical protein
METIDKIKAEVVNLNGKISSDDKLEAARELGVHPGTVDRYLRGDMRKETFALDLLSFLKNRVTQREKVLS